MFSKIIARVKAYTSNTRRIAEKLWQVSPALVEGDFLLAKSSLASKDSSKIAI